MPSRKRHRFLPEDVYASLQEIRTKEVQRMKTTFLTMEQRYEHYIASVLDVKKRVGYQLYTNLLDKIVDIFDKQTTIMNSYYQTEITQLQKEKQDLIRKNQKHQKLIQQFQTQELARKKRRFQHFEAQHKHPAFLSSDHEADLNNHNAFADDIASSMDLLHVHSQSVTPPIAAITDNDNNPFITLPKFDMNAAPNAVVGPTISSLTHSSLLNVHEAQSEDDDAVASDSSTVYGIDSKKKIKKDTKKRKKRKRKRKKKKSFRYKYLKRKDKQILTAPARVGNVDKTWLFCNHASANGDGLCGVKFIRTLKDREDQAQHYCDGDEAQKLITRKFGSQFKKCAYCQGENVCTRLATIDEIEIYQKQCKDLNIVPNTYGGYKVIGAKQTKARFTTRDSTRKRVRGRPKKKRTKAQTEHSKTKRHKKRGQRAVSVGFESMLPRLHDSNDTGAKSDDAERGKSIWNEDEDDTTVSDLGNRPLRRSRKRKRAEFEDGNDSYDSVDFERDAKRQKIDRSTLMELDLDELLLQAFSFEENLAWDKEDLWCRYCGARGSNAWLLSPWGEKKLCEKHGKLWKKNELDLNDIIEPMQIGHVINKEMCTERSYLIDLMVKHGDESCILMHGRRRSMRNIKKEREKQRENVSSSESDGSYEDSSCDSDIGKDDEDDDEPIAMRMNRMQDDDDDSDDDNNNVRNGDDVMMDDKNTEKEKEPNIQNVTINMEVTEHVNNDPTQDEDDDIFGVD